MFVYLFVLGTGCMSTGYHTLALGTPVRLTKDILLQTQKHRAMEVCPKTEAFAGYDSFFSSLFFLQPACRVAVFLLLLLLFFNVWWCSIFMYRGLGAHAAYNSYNPVSRQDSEMQSVSSHSDAKADSDTMSLTDSSV